MTRFWANAHTGKPRGHKKHRTVVNKGPDSFTPPNLKHCLHSGRGHYDLEIHMGSPLPPRECGDTWNDKHEAGNFAQ